MYTYTVIKIDRVIDGDTVDAIIDLGFNISIKQRVRIIGVDAPELRSRDVEEREMAKKATEFAERWMATGGRMVVTTYKDDKYGRILGDFKLEQSSETFSEALMKAGLAKKYIG